MGTGRDAEDAPRGHLSPVEEKGKKHTEETLLVFPRKQSRRQGMEMTSEGVREAEGSSGMLGRSGIHSRTEEKEQPR